jgi:hypothetical protein
MAGISEEHSLTGGCLINSVRILLALLFAALALALASAQETAKTKPLSQALLYGMKNNEGEECT